MPDKNHDKDKAKHEDKHEDKPSKTPGTVSPEDFMTEQDKAAAAKETKKET